MAIHLGEASLKRLADAHPDLQRVVMRAAAWSDVPFVVLETLRSAERQRELVKKGASKTMKSRHLAGPCGRSRAVDIAPLEEGQVSWRWPLYHKLAPILKKAALLEAVPLEWGGDWKTFKDGPHWQLPAARYP